MKYGFEREYYLATVATRGKPSEYVLVDGLPRDDCGFLVEARGVPQSTVRLAAYALISEEDSIKQAVKDRFPGKKLILQANAKLPKKLRTAALNLHGKAGIPTSRGNIYGKLKPFKGSTTHAGLHVHFSDVKEVVGVNGVRNVVGFIDFPRYILALDKAFAAEIKAAGRGPGYYEVKHYYGVEYRSLPADVDLMKVVEVIEKV